MPATVCFIVLGIVSVPVVVGACVSCKYCLCEMPACCGGTWDKEKWKKHGGCRGTPEQPIHSEECSCCDSCCQWAPYAYCIECCSDLNAMAHLSRQTERNEKIRRLGGTPPRQDMVMYTCKGSGKTKVHSMYTDGLGGLNDKFYRDH